MMTVLTNHETIFGDTCLTFAASLGRLSIVMLFLDESKRIAHSRRNDIAVSDIINRETSRGKMALIEAVKNGHVEVASTLITNSANIQLRSKIHYKSSLSWAVTLKNPAMLDMINKHIKLSVRNKSLFKAISNGDTEAVASLTKGGVPYSPFAPPAEDRLEAIRSQLEEEKHSHCELQQLLSQFEPKVAVASAERDNRVIKINSLRNLRRESVSTRRRDFIETVAILRLAATDNNISDLCNCNNQPPLEYELIAKALLTLFHIKVNKDDNNSRFPYFRQMQTMMKDKTKFLHRLKNYQLVPFQAKLSAAVQVEGIPGACSDYISALEDKSATSRLGAVMCSLTKYLLTIFTQISTHEREHELLMQQRVEDDLLQRNLTDIEVLKSRCSILRLELGNAVESIQKYNKEMNKLQREIEVKDLVRAKQFNGQTPLSWAAANGNRDIVKVLLKHGASTVIEERCVRSCATIIQISYRHYLWKREHPVNDNGLEFELRERERCMRLHIQSLSHYIRSHFNSLCLPFSEALFSGNTNVVSLLDKSDTSIFQAINLLHLFHAPRGNIIPRPPNSAKPQYKSNMEDLLSSIILAGNLYQNSTKDCPFMASLKVASSSIDAYLQHRKYSLEKKISSRLDTLWTLNSSLDGCGEWGASNKHATVLDTRHSYSMKSLQSLDDG